MSKKLRFTSNIIAKDSAKLNGESEGGGGGGGTTDYSELENKPRVNGVELVGNKSSNQLGIQEVNFSHVDGDIDDTGKMHAQNIYRDSSYNLKMSILGKKEDNTPFSFVTDLIPTGGTPGQVLKRNANFGVDWGDESGGGGGASVKSHHLNSQIVVRNIGTESEPYYEWTNLGNPLDAAKGIPIMNSSVLAMMGMAESEVENHVLEFYMTVYVHFHTGSSAADTKAGYVTLHFVYGKLGFDTPRWVMCGPTDAAAPRPGEGSGVVLCHGQANNTGFETDFCLYESAADNYLLTINYYADGLDLWAGIPLYSIGSSSVDPSFPESYYRLLFIDHGVEA